MQVIRHIRYKYACKGCEGVESNEGAVKTASLPPQIIAQGIATAGLVAHIATSKFVDAQPFYRQEKQFARIGVDISRATMANWMIHVGNQSKPLIPLLRSGMFFGPVINIDETRVQVMNEPGRLNTSQSYMWVFLGGPRDGPSIIYQYQPTRAGDVAKDFLRGYSGYVQTDAYAGYNALESPEIRLLGCWAHARRNFMDMVKATKKSGRKSGSADLALGFIRNLYRIEKKVVEMELGPDGIYRVRQEESKPILDKFFEWLNKRTIETPPKGLLGKAISYTLNNWERLIRYLENGLLLPDNNLVENAIRPFVLGRKNWLFSGHPRGAEASANLYSLIETAKANGLEPYRYLRFLFEKLPYAKTEDDYRALLPQNVKAADLANITNLS
jgi:transposase